jgi:polyketide synthase 12/myxalamid-type polyketide synthase MxaB
VLKTLLRSEAIQAGAFSVDWDQLLELGQLWGWPYLEAVAPAKGTESAVASKEAEELLLRLQGADSTGRREFLAGYVRTLVANVLNLDAPESLDLQQPLNETGLDSLMAVEIRNALSRGLGHALPVALVFHYPTIQAIADYLTEEIGTVEPGTVAEDKVDDRAAMFSEIEQLSESEADESLARLVDEAFARTGIFSNGG